MIKFKITFLVTIFTIVAFAQEDDMQKQMDSIENSFKYEYGTISLKNGVGTIEIPKGFKFLDETQAKRVLVDLWGNPDSDNISLGLIFPEKTGILDSDSYVFNVQYDEIGYVEDDDADDIDYDDLLKELKDETAEANKIRQKEGYETVSIIGWAAPPYYDKERKILHWAKEIKFGQDSINTLNYNIRILGRKGVLVLNAIASKEALPLVQKDINKVLNIVKFNDGYKYGDFDSSVDSVAAWTIGGLVAGKVLTKVGFFAIIAKFGKIIVVALLGLFGVFKNKIKGIFSSKSPANRKEDDVDVENEELKENS